MVHLYLREGSNINILGNTQRLTGHKFFSNRQITASTNPVGNIHCVVNIKHLCESDLELPSEYEESNRSMSEDSQMQLRHLCTGYEKGLAVV